jgi:phage terminase Nu1 subunit (DNA packaging protein)
MEAYSGTVHPVILMTNIRSPVVIPAGDEIVSGAELAVIIGLGHKMVVNLANDGHIIRNGNAKNQYLLRASFKSLIAYKNAEISTLREENDPQMRAAKLAIANADLAFKETRNKKQSGDLIERSELLPCWSRVALATKTALMQVPSKARQIIPKLTRADQKTLDKIVREGLTNAGVGKDPPRIGIEEGSMSQEDEE